MNWKRTTLKTTDMNFLTEDLLQTICRTLVHSLWQGLILALLTGFVIWLTRKASAALRYNLLGFLSLAFLLTVCVTFYQEFQSKTAESRAILSAVQQQDLSIVNTSIPLQKSTHVIHAEQQDVFLYVVRFLDTYANWIVVAWFLIFSLKFFRILRGMQQIHVLRNCRTLDVPDFWQQRLLELQQQLKISVKIRLLQSPGVDVPSVTGFFKPLILVPIGLLNNLPQEQVEAILLHELAHIRRNDYLVNLTQSFAEILFFFNPAVWWLSALIRSERENCCDDLAIGVTQSKQQFVHALVSFQEYKSASGQLAMQFGGQRHSLADRARRVLFNSNKTLNAFEKGFVATCIVLGIGLSFAFAQRHTPNRTAVHAMPTTAIPPDSLLPILDVSRIQEGLSMKFTNLVIGQKETTYLFKHQGTVYQVSEDLQVMKINGKLVPAREIEKHWPLLESLIAAYNDSEEEAAEIEREASEIEAESARIDEESAQIEAESARIEADSRRIELESRAIEAESRRIEQESRRIEQESRRIEAESRRIETQSRRIEVREDRISSVIQQQPEPAVCIPAAPVEPAANSSDDKLSTQIINDLNRYGFVDRSGTSEVSSFTLSYKKLIVNGVRQSDELHEKLKKRIKPYMKISFVERK
jgi:bla regulator protein BlaR1